MEEEKKEEVVVPAEETIVEPTEDGKPEEQTEDYREKLNITNRFLKKEGYEFKDGKWVKPPKVEEAPKPVSAKTDDLTVMDGILLTQAGFTTEEDIRTVKEYQKLNGISLSEAVKSPLVKGIIDERREKQASAQVSATNASRRAPSKPSDDAVLEKFRTKGAEALTKAEAEQLFWANRGKKK